MLMIYTVFHVILSLIGIAAGLVVVYGFLTSDSPRNAAFPVDDSSHQRDRLLLPVPWADARHRDRHFVADRFSGSIPRPQPLAQNICNQPP